MANKGYISSAPLKSLSYGDVRPGKLGNSVKKPELNAEKGNSLQPNIQDILFETIFPNPKNRKTMESISELADSITREGLLHPLAVVPAKGGYMLISGERRYRAIKELRGRSPEYAEEFRTVKCSVLEPGDELKQEIQLIAANTSTQELTPQEYREAVSAAECAFEAMVRRGDKFSASVQEMTASIFGVSTRQIRKLKIVNERLLPELRDAYDKRELTLSAAAKIAGLDEVGQEEILRIYKASGTVSEESVENYRLIKSQEESGNPNNSGEENGDSEKNGAEDSAPKGRENARSDVKRIESGLNRLERALLNFAQVAKKMELNEGDRARVLRVAEALTDLYNGADVDIKSLIRALSRNETSSPEGEAPEEGAEEG